MLHWNQIWKPMHDLTEAPVDKRAVAEVITYLEGSFQGFIEEIITEHNNINKNLRAQGLPEKKRISQEAVKRTIDKKKKNNQKTPYNVAGDDKKRTEKEKSASAINEKKEVSKNGKYT